MAYIANPDRYNDMEYARCGQSGLLLPRVSMGFWQNFGTNTDPATIKELCFTALDCGITYFDLANNYGPEPGAAERNLGELLRTDLKPYRDELIISTKAGHPMWPGPYGNWGSRKHLIASLDQSLMRLGVDYVDIFYHHRMDPNTPLEETINTLCDIVKQGKALYIGLSKYDGPHMERAAQMLEKRHCPFIVCQNRYNMLDRTIETNGLEGALLKKDKGMVAFSPLARGFLTDRYFNGIPEGSYAARNKDFARTLTDKRLAQVSCLNALAAERGQTLAQMALSWVLRNKVVTTVLVGASTPEQIRENAAAACQNHHFTDVELNSIDAILDLPQQA